MERERCSQPSGRRARHVRFRARKVGSDGHRQQYTMHARFPTTSRPPRRVRRFRDSPCKLGLGVTRLSPQRNQPATAAEAAWVVMMPPAAFNCFHSLVLPVVSRRSSRVVRRGYLSANVVNSDSETGDSARIRRASFAD
jgi:hypothetical protein